MTNAEELAESLINRPHVRDAQAVRPSLVMVTSYQRGDHQHSTFTAKNWPEWSVCYHKHIDGQELYMLSSESWGGEDE